jgi:hypothetical protein
MTYRINGQRVVMSGTAIVKKGEVLEVVAEDGTVLRLDWNRPDDRSAAGGTDSMKLLTGSFPDEQAFPHVHEWGIGNPENGPGVSIRVFAELIPANDRVVSFTVLANF